MYWRAGSDAQRQPAPRTRYSPRAAQTASELRRNNCPGVYLDTSAEALPPATVATLDAIHLAAALRLAADGHVESLMTFDARLAEGAGQHGLAVIAPS